LSLHQIQEALNTKVGLTGIAGVAVTGNAASFYDINMSGAIQWMTFLSLLSVFIINIPKMYEVLSAPFRKSPEEDS